MGWLKFISELTGDSTSKVSAANHEARDNSDVRKGEDSKHFEKAPSWADSKTDGGSDLFPKGKGP